MLPLLQIFFPPRTLGVVVLVRGMHISHLAPIQVIAFLLWVMVLVEEGCGQKMQVSGLERQWKHKTMKDRGAKEEMDRKRSLMSNVYVACVCVCVCVCVYVCVCVCVCVCVVHLYCSVQFSMFNMEKRYRSKINIIIIITSY